jgi:hypothetical protein
MTQSTNQTSGQRSSDTPCHFGAFGALFVNRTNQRKGLTSQIAVTLGAFGHNFGDQLTNCRPIVEYSANLKERNWCAHVR